MIDHDRIVALDQADFLFAAFASLPDDPRAADPDRLAEIAQGQARLAAACRQQAEEFVAARARGEYDQTTAERLAHDLAVRRVRADVADQTFGRYLAAAAARPAYKLIRLPEATTHTTPEEGPR